MLQHQQSQSQWGPAPTGPGGFAPPPQTHPQQPVGTTWNPQAPPPPSAPVQHQPGGLYGGGAFANAQYQQNQQYGNYTAQQQSCCPTQQPPGAAPHGYCCNPPMPNEPPMWPLHQMCDITTCAVFFFALMSIIGFGVVLGTTKPDNLFDVYDAKNTAELQIMMSKHFDFPNMTLVSNETEAPPTPEPTPAPAPPCYCPCNFTTLAPPTTAAPPSTTPALTTTAPSTTHASTVAPAATTRAPTTATPRPSTVAPSNNTRTMTITLPRATSPAATSRRQLEEIPPIRGEWEIPICNYTKGFTGAFGEVCMEETLNAAVMAVNLSRWTAFRGTLYFIAMLGSFLILALIIIVHRVQHPMPQFGQPGAPQQFPMPEPWQFFGTKLYEVFRVVWGAVSVVMFLWIVNEMYSYWKIVPFYKEHTKDDLKAFWRDYDRKFVATVVCGGIYVCWPLCEMALEIALWFAGLIPWFGYRTMCAQGIGQVRFPETPIEELPGCVRVDMFYVDCEQAGRLGFSTRMWEMITGTRAKYLDCLDQCGQPPGGYAGGAVPGGYGGGIASQAPSIVAPRPGSMGGELPAQPTQVTRGFGVPQYGQPVQQPVTVQPPSPEWQGGFNSSQPVATSQSGNFVNQSGAFGGANTSGSFVRSSRSFAADDSSDDDEKKSKKSKKEKSEKKEKHSKKEKSSKKEKKDKS